MDWPDSVCRGDNLCPGERLFQQLLCAQRYTKQSAYHCNADTDTDSRAGGGIWSGKNSFFFIQNPEDSRPLCFGFEVWRYWIYRHDRLCRGDDLCRFEPLFLAMRPFQLDLC